jgi:pyruvate/2-oxoacid:ferredoxin oxidoreductase alpha subunit
MDAFRGSASGTAGPDDGRACTHRQAEDELSAAGIVIGAGWAGARSFTPTAGPGISLMSEFIGLAYYAEVPASSSTCSAPARPPACRRARSRAT